MDFVSATDGAFVRQAIVDSGLFDEFYYTLQLPYDLYLHVTSDDEFDPLEHFLQVGWREGFNPSPSFSVKAYLNSYPAVRSLSVNPLIHYIILGKDQGFRCFESDRIQFDNSDSNVGQIYSLIVKSGYFDSFYYLSMYDDVKQDGIDPLKHYIEFGYKEDRNPSSKFDTKFYIEANDDVRLSGAFPLEHFLRIGLSEGRLARPRNSIDVRSVARSFDSSGELRCVIHLHAYYVVLALDIIAHCNRVRDLCDLIITVDGKENADFIDRYTQTTYPEFKNLQIIVTPNSGRDIGPLAWALNETWNSYEYVCHLHTKYSPHTHFGHKWRTYLIDALIGSRLRVKQIIEEFSSQSNIGMIYPDHYFEIKKFMNDDSNISGLENLLIRMGLSTDVQPQDFPAGSMFWARTDALAPFFLARLQSVEFDAELGQVDGTLAHAAERAFTHIVRAQGYQAKRLFASPTHYDALKRHRHEASEEQDFVGNRWLRDTPSIFKDRVKVLTPRSTHVDIDQIYINWVIPDFRAGAGGHTTIFRFVAALALRGHVQVVWIQNARNYANPSAAKAAACKYYSPSLGNVIFRFLPDDLTAISGDILIATDCWSAFPVAQATNFKMRYYFIQDFEPMFHPVGDLYFTAEATYHFGLKPLCAGDWLSSLMTDYGLESVTWYLASDPSVYIRNIERRFGAGIATIAFYARPYTPRRLVGVGFAALEQLARMGIRFKVVSFGEQLGPMETAFEHECRGILAPKDLAALYLEADVGLVLSATNYSLVPLEMMACGLPVVDLDIESTRAVYDANAISLAAPNPMALADALKDIICNPDKASEISQGGTVFSKKFSWDKSISIVEEAFRNDLSSKYKVLQRKTRTAPFVRRVPSASVFIPTYNAGEEFGGVLESVMCQKTSFDFDVVVYDSDSNDMTPDIIKSAMKRYSNLSYSTLKKNEFQHGRTRDIGIQESRGSHVALITQDATPASEYWLDNLLSFFSIDNEAAFCFGRHAAYNQHGPYARAELNETFNWISAFGSKLSLKSRMPNAVSYGQKSWEMLMYFNSDNNTCVNKAVWKTIRYPHVDWGEDQIWAKEVMQLGFSKLYANSAVVNHSHSFSIKKQFEVSFQEGSLLTYVYGLDPAIRKQTLLQRARELCDRDAMRVPNQKVMRSRFYHHLATISGRYCGSNNIDNELLRAEDNDAFGDALMQWALSHESFEEG